MQCFSFQFAGNESRVSVVQYSGSKAQEVVQFGANIATLSDFKQWVQMHADKAPPVFVRCCARCWISLDYWIDVITLVEVPSVLVM